MEDIFRGYWWLIFPLFGFAMAGWDSWLKYRRQQSTIELLKTYAAKGDEPPAQLLQALERPQGENAGAGKSREGHLYSVVMFGVMAAGFTYAAVTDLFGVGSAFVIVAVVMAALALASLVILIATRPRG
ncbi:hypothetical protein [Caulobacter sp. NIBR2454]|uniref:hypothetical protein n=1 Tax=Caulobacter sp. NIBR2454 TaxID=3015996 RepID=UPI0022B741EC|nr:hypothetical protein [Caulobacter sp. NIBR2454]